MKYLFLTVFFSLTSAHHTHGNNTFKNALQSAGAQLITAKSKFDSSLVAQATIPVLAGATAGALATVASAAWYNYRYYRYKTEENTNPLFINTIIHGGATSEPLPNVSYKSVKHRLKHGCKLAGNKLYDNLFNGIFWSGLFGIVYGLYKHGFTTDSGKVSVGTIGTGLLSAFIAHQALVNTGQNKKRTFFIKYQI